MIAAVCTAYNEADIIGISCDHLLASGVDHIYVALAESSDDTAKILAGIEHVTVVDDSGPYHLQPEWTTTLARMAETDGATWVIPFDADEFVYAPFHDDIPTALASVPADVNKLWVARWLHTTWDNRYLEHEHLQKVAWRTGVPFGCTPGNHDVHIEGADCYDVLHMRELQFRSYVHMVRKCHERVDRIDPTLSADQGAHQRRLAAMTDDQLKTAWITLQETPTAYDPIPVR